jgi:redox-sensitive bicupin YhaK (pirin superfamily)
VASPDCRDDSLKIHADAVLYAGLFDGAEQATLALAPNRRAYVHVARGRVVVNDQQLSGGDALKLLDVTAVNVQHGEHAEVLVFDLA